MPQLYVCTIDATAATAAVSFFELTPADDKVLCIHKLLLGQTTDVGDAAEENLEIEFHRGGSAMTSGTGGTSAAAGASTDGLGPTSGFTFEAMNTTAATYTGGVIVHRDVIALRPGIQEIPLPEDRIYVRQSNGGFDIRLGAAPADTVTWAGMLIVEEL